MNIAERCSRTVCDIMRGAIEEANGCEVFFTGTLDSEGVVVSIDIICRGNETSVPVQPAAASTASVLIHNHPSGKLTPSDADMRIASAAAERAQGFYIIDNNAERIYVVVEPVRERSLQMLDEHTVSAFICAGGPLSSINPDFEERPEQIALLQHICRTFNKNGIGVFEAGTGVGKSYAYLLPAMLWSAVNKEKVVVSTGTINLQHQLMDKDIPMAVEILGQPVKAVLVKGRQNYLCLRRFEDIVSEPDLFYEDNDGLDRIRDWVRKTSSGSRSDLSFNPSERIWSRICSESDACLGMKCPYHGDCFVMKVRKEASGADILIVNHHLLFADIETRAASLGYDAAAVLPPYRRIIFDEAHGIEAAATSFFSERFSRFRILRQLNSLYRSKKNKTFGLLGKLIPLTANQDAVQEAMNLTHSVRTALDNLDTAGLEVMDTGHTCRLFPDTERNMKSLFGAFAALRSALIDFTAQIYEIIDGIEEKYGTEPSVWETRQIMRRLDACAAFCRTYPQWAEHEESVFWMEKRQSRQYSDKSGPFYPVFVQTPLDIASRMNTGIFEPMSSVVCTSATIRIGHTFDFWMKRTGIIFCEQERIDTGEFCSPFPYRRNMLFAVPSDAPFVDSAHFRRYMENAVTELIKTVGGRTLVLFTSYDTLRSACSYARGVLRSLGINVFMQGDDDRARLLDTFRKDETSVLFATDSFWEGIDVPGASLSQVIITRLPFSVPDDPIFAARAEYIEKHGGNAFLELSVPESVIKFRQGVGRLIRRSDDRGAVVVLDKRIAEKSYGHIFLDSLPNVRRRYEPLSEILQAVGRHVDV